jgi:hypothetical protein
LQLRLLNEIGRQIAQVGVELLRLEEECCIGNEGEDVSNGHRRRRVLEVPEDKDSRSLHWDGNVQHNHDAGVEDRTPIDKDARRQRLAER